jgi:hypothetical protein
MDFLYEQDINIQEYLMRGNEEESTGGTEK